MSRQELEQRGVVKLVNYDKAKGHPVGRSFFYECLLCHDFVEADPDWDSECQCGNFWNSPSDSRLGASQGDDSFLLYRGSNPD